MTLSTFRSRWSGGTKASTSTITISFRESFFQFSIFNPPFLYYNRKTSPPARFFDKLTGVRSQWKRTPVIFVLYPAAAAHSKAQPRTTQAAHNVGQL